MTGELILMFRWAPIIDTCDPISLTDPVQFALCFAKADSYQSVVDFIDR